MKYCRAARRARRLAAVGSVFPLLMAPAAIAKHHKARATRCGRPGSAARLSCTAVSARGGWQRYVLDPRSALVYPKRVAVVGDASRVGHAAGLMAAGGAVTTINASAAGAPRLVLDLGANVGGRVEVGITAGDGARVRLSYAERRADLTPTGDNTGGSLGTDDDPNGRFDLISATGPSSFVSPGIRGGERWIAIQLDAAGTVSIDYVRVLYDGLRLTPSQYDGHFLSNDDLVNRTWYSSVYTNDLDAIRKAPGNRVFVDGAKRDRLVWSGDLGIEGLTAAYTSPRALQIDRSSLSVFACQQFIDDPTLGGSLQPASLIDVRCPARNPTARANHVTTVAQAVLKAIPLGAYNGNYVSDLYLYYLYSGDSAFVRQQLPAARAALAWMAGRERAGVYFTNVPNEINWHPFDDAHGVDANTNEVYYEALLDMARLERTVGRGTRAASVYDRHAASVRRALIAQLWDRRARAFRGNSASTVADHTDDAQIYGTASGMLRGTAAVQALAFVRDRLWTRLGPATAERRNDPFMQDYISPYISSWELWARFEFGDARTALDLDRRLFGRMASGDPGTMWEKINFDGTPAAYRTGQGPAQPGATSLAHGWGTGPASALPAFVLGIRPLSPGYRSWIVAPEPGDLRWAQGQAPTPRGSIVSRWQLGARRRSLRLTVIGPHSTPGAVGVPLLGHTLQIWQDGLLVWNRGRAVGGSHARQVGDAIEFTGIRGRHTFAWQI